MHPQITSVLNWADPYSPKPNEIVRDNAEKVLNYIDDINLEHELSIGVSAILMATYLAHLVFSLVTHKNLFNPENAKVHDNRASWSRRTATIVLIVATVFVAIMSEILTDSLVDTPAIALQTLLEPYFGQGKIEVIDLARTNLFYEVRELAIGALQLEPDAVVISVRVDHPIERLKDIEQLLLGNPSPVVSDRHSRIPGI